MIDHVSVIVRDYQVGKAFYLQALLPTGHSTLVELCDPVGGESRVAGFCHADGSDFWIKEGDLSSPIHIAFRVATRATVDAFYQDAIAAGGKANGEPRLRPHYHASYYSAYVLDPDGHNIEAVCHEAE